MISENPFRKIKVKFKETMMLPRIIPREEIEQLLNYMYAQENNMDKFYKYWLRDIAIIEILFATGARVCEISNIREDSVNLNTGLIKIMGKGGKERYVSAFVCYIFNRGGSGYQLCAAASWAHMI